MYVDPVLLKELLKEALDEDETLQALRFTLYVLHIAFFTLCAVVSANFVSNLIWNARIARFSIFNNVATLFFVICAMIIFGTLIL